MDDENFEIIRSFQNKPKTCRPSKDDFKEKIVF